MPTAYLESLTNRGAEWMDFAEKVLDHVDNYTVPQYGDSPADQASNFTLDDFKTTIQRYVNRMGRNARGPVEAQRDMLKIAHYACLAAAKLAEQETPAA